MCKRYSSPIKQFIYLLLEKIYTCHCLMGWNFSLMMLRNFTGFPGCPGKRHSIVLLYSMS